ncbi:MAG TPA: metal-dependent hydrolase [Holophagaceae bacterium]|nr:metal-dependent hydrolase [Holophagaceae bacterium]
MSPGAHLLASWILADRFEPEQQGRRLVALVGVIPDLDGLGVVADVLDHGRTEYYATYHHLLGHNLLFGLLVSGLAALLARRGRGRVFALALLAFHFHLLFDLMGSRGADGYQWPIPYLVPLMPKVELAWRHQWLFNGWQNLVILGALLVWAFLLAARNRRSLIEVISPGLEREVFKAVNQRWGVRA